jgi:hypothetical protein
MVTVVKATGTGSGEEQVSLYMNHIDEQVQSAYLQCL